MLLQQCNYEIIHVPYKTMCNIIRIVHDDLGYLGTDKVVENILRSC